MPKGISVVVTDALVKAINIFCTLTNITPRKRYVYNCQPERCVYIEMKPS